MSRIIRLFVVWSMSLALISSLLLLTACTSSKRMNAGIISFHKQNYREAFLLLIPLAQSGNPEAQYAVGYMYYYGQGVTEDQHQASLWLQRAAAAGQPQAIQAMHLLDNSGRIKGQGPTTIEKTQPL